MVLGKAVEDTLRRAARALARRGRRARLRPSPRQEGEAGPFDVVGDIPGCLDTARALLARLGYESVGGWVHRHTDRRRALFLGDYIDRGPASPGVLRLVHATCGGKELGSQLRGATRRPWAPCSAGTSNTLG